MWHSFLEGGADLMSGSVLLVLFLGAVLGLAIGILPGVGGTFGCALLLPFIFGMSPETGLILILALASVTHTSGSIPSILLAVAGTGPNAATIFDGHPMAQKGEAGRAIGIATSSSGFGGILSVLFALAVIPLVLPLALAIGSPEMVFLILLGLTFIASLSRGALTKGLISGALGILLASIGYQASTGFPRFTLGSFYLYEGLDMITLVLGVFAMVQLVDMGMRGRKAIADLLTAPPRLRDVFRGTKDVIAHRWLFLRSTLIGYFVGLIPGIGGETSSFVAYAQAQLGSKHPEKFGTGIPEGIVAPEAANNAKDGGALLTTLVLGIPGSAVMAILLGGFIMVGITPGPQMLDQYMPLAFTLLEGCALANLIAMMICYLIAPHLAKITRLDFDFLFPVLITFIFVGAFVTTERVESVLALLIFSALGYAMMKFGYNVPAMFLGFILGKQFEHYFWLSKFTGGWLFFLKPSCIVIIVIIIILLSLQFLTPSLRRLVRRARRA